MHIMSGNKLPYHVRFKSYAYFFFPYPIILFKKCIRKQQYKEQKLQFCPGDGLINRQILKLEGVGYTKIVVAQISLSGDPPPPPSPP
jgi:hypothetical protein